MLDSYSSNRNPVRGANNIINDLFTTKRVLPAFMIFFIAIMIILPCFIQAEPRTRAVSFNMELISEEPINEGVLVLYPGDYYYFYLKLTNTGDTDDTYDLAIESDMPEWAITFNGGVTSTSVAVSSAPGSNVEEVLVLVNIPDTAKKGQVAELKFSASSTADTGQTRSLDLMIMINYIQPHVLLDTEEPDKLVEPGAEPASFLISVENLGFESVEYYPPEPADFNLAEGWTVEITKAGTPMVLGPAGTNGFYVNVSAPKAAGVQERVKLNIKGFSTNINTTILPVDISVKVKQIHDLDFTGPLELLVLEPLEEVVYEVSVKNNGNGPETVEIIFETPSEASSWKPHISESSIILSVDSQIDLRINFTPALDAKNDKYIFNLKVNMLESGVIVATDSFTTEVEIRYVPDLAIDSTDISFSATYLEQDQTITINATIHNIAIIPASNVSVHFVATTGGGSQKSIGTVTVPYIEAGGTAVASIEWSVDPATSLISVQADNTNEKFEVDEDNNIGLKSVFIFKPIPKVSSDDGSGAGFGMGIGTIGAIVVLTALVSISSVMVLVTLSTEAGRYRLLTFFMPLYSKVRREDVLMHETREMVYDFVKSHPGEHFRAIMAKLSLTNGTLAHHLYTLEKQEFIKSERDGPYKRFYPRGFKFTGDVMEVNGIQKKILDTIEGNPGISQKNLARILHISPPTVNYHIKTMVGARLVELQRNGKETSCYRIKAE